MANLTFADTELIPPTIKRLWDTTSFFMKEMDDFYASPSIPFEVKRDTWLATPDMFRKVEPWVLNLSSYAAKYRERYPSWMEDDRIIWFELGHERMELIDLRNYITNISNANKEDASAADAEIRAFLEAVAEEGWPHAFRYDW